MVSWSACCRPEGHRILHRGTGRPAETQASYLPQSLILSKTCFLKCMKWSPQVPNINLPLYLPPSSAVLSFFLFIKFTQYTLITFSTSRSPESPLLPIHPTSCFSLSLSLSLLISLQSSRFHCRTFIHTSFRLSLVVRPLLPFSPDPYLSCFNPSTLYTPLLLNHTRSISLFSSLS